MSDKLSWLVLRRPVWLLAFGFGSGLAPVAPGTFGTVAAVILYVPLSLLPLPIYLLAVVIAFALGIYLCGTVARDLGVHDHGGIVWDEFTGYWIAMVAAPAGWQWMLTGFVLFRLFDILKPFPIGWLDKRIGGGLGIMLDDAVAGTFAWLCLQIAVMVIAMRGGAPF